MESQPPMQNTVRKIVRVVGESPAELREPLMAYLSQNQAGEIPDPACLFVAIVELQDQVNRLTHECQQLREQLADTDAAVDKVSRLSLAAPDPLRRREPPQ